MFHRFPLSVRAEVLLSICLLLAPKISLASESQQASPNPEMMRCSPSNATLETVLNITFPAQHGSQFAIIAPNSDYFFVSFEQADPQSELQPFLPSKEFAGMVQWNISVSEIKGTLWTLDGKTEKVFTANGSYKFVVSNNLETEDALLDGVCEINFGTSP